ncbi:DUF4270 family protein [Filimonas effusa]|nr:DUF4270 family protein [Filimonas effusa]
MQKKRQYVPVLSTLLAVGVLFAASSCKKVDIDFGGQYVPNESSRVVKVDTITPVVSTVYADSFSTAATGTMLLGAHTDPYFGRSVASSYFEFAPPTGTTYDVNAEYDSIILVIKPASTRAYYGDTLTDLHIGVQELNEEIVPVRPGSTTYSTLFNTTSFTKKSGFLNIGNTRTAVRVQPSITDTIVVRLNDQFGANLFNLLKTNSQNIQNSTAFINEVLKGVYISAGANDNVILNLKDSVDMRLYYTTPGRESIHSYVTFTLANNAHHFNHIDIDRTGTPLGNAGFGKNKQVISSEDLGNRAFMQYITGSMVKIQFPTAKASILNAPDFTSILSAHLVIRPLIGSYENTYKKLPASIRLSTTNINNLIGSDLTSSSGSSMQVQTGNLVVDDRNPKSTAYTYDVTSYLLQQINLTTIDNGNGLLMSPPANTTSFDRLVVGNANNTDARMVLTIYYLAVNK